MWRKWGCFAQTLSAGNERATLRAPRCLRYIRRDATSTGAPRANRLHVSPPMGMGERGVWEMVCIRNEKLFQPNCLPMVHNSAIGVVGHMVKIHTSSLRTAVPLPLNPSRESIKRIRMLRINTIQYRPPPHSARHATPTTLHRIPQRIPYLHLPSPPPPCPLILSTTPPHNAARGQARSDRVGRG